MPGTDGVIYALLAFAALVVVGVAIVAHYLIRRYWQACLVITVVALLGCGALHAVDHQINDATSIVMLYGIGGVTAFCVSATVGLPFLWLRRRR